MGGGKAIYWSSLFLAGAILLLGIHSESYIVTACAVSAILFCLVQFRLAFLMHKGSDAQMKACKAVGFLLLLPATALIATGISILFWPDALLPAGTTYTIIGLSGLLLVCFLFQFLALQKDGALAARFLRLTIAASWSAPLSLIVVLLLRITEADKIATLSCMTVSLLGGAVFLIAANMIMVSNFDYRRTTDCIRAIRLFMKRHSLVLTRFSILKDAFLVVGKTIISVISLSFFMFVNALYSAGMGIARYVAVKMHTQEGAEQAKSYRRVGIIISVASVCYVLYSVRLFFSGQTGVYDMNVALVIALYTFIEFGINIREAIRLRKSKALEAKALRAVSFASTLICFVLTQTAIMSFAAEGDNSFTNALSGVFFGGLATLIGLYVIIDSFSHKKEAVDR